MRFPCGCLILRLIIRSRNAICANLSPSVLGFSVEETMWRYNLYESFSIRGDISAGSISVDHFPVDSGVEGEGNPAIYEEIAKTCYE